MASIPDCATRQNGRFPGSHLLINEAAMSVTNEQLNGRIMLHEAVDSKPPFKRVALFTSCDSFEGFYGGTFGLDRETFLGSYRNDFVWEYSEGLRQCGHEVFIYILSYGPPELRKITPGVSVRFIPLPKWLRAVDSFLWRLRGLKHGPSLRDRTAYMAYGDTLRAAILEDRIEMLYHQEIWTSRFDIVVEKSSIPVIGADHGAVFLDWMAPAKRKSFKQAAEVICQSQTGLERARSFGADPVLMANGVDTTFFVPPASAALRQKTVLAVGRLVEEQKRFSDLLRAMQFLPDFSLILVGSGPDETRLRKLVADLGLSERVCLAGFVSDRKELRRLYQECGVFVSTSNWEAVALVMLEAMSCAAPVVATRIPSFEDLFTDGEDGLLVSVGAPGEVAQAILAAYERQEQLGAKARHTVETRYSSGVLYGRLSNLIEKS
jgi:glycosyltransferase involved in cell wall biosynthesis